jgi:hypothetical protein
MEAGRAENLNGDVVGNQLRIGDGKQPLIERRLGRRAQARIERRLGKRAYDRAPIGQQAAGVDRVRATGLPCGDI